MTFMLRIVNDPGAPNGISDWPLCPCDYCADHLNALLRHNGPFTTADQPRGQALREAAALAALEDDE